MAVTQVHEALGNFTFKLVGNIPRDLLDEIEYFGHIAILPGRMDPRQYGDGCLDAARYVGVVRRKKIGAVGNNAFTASHEISGPGMEFWLGDEDGKGEVIEGEYNPVLQSFSTVVAALKPDSLDNGTVYTVTGSYSGRHQYETPRTALKYVCETMSTDAIPVGYKVTNAGALDAGPESDLFVTTPTCVIVRKGASQGEDMFMRSLPGTLDLDQDMEDFSTRVVMIAEVTGDTVATGSADIGTIAPGVNIYKDLQGNALNLTRLVSESDTLETNADTRAEIALRKVIEANRQLNIDADDYDINGSFDIGDYVWVYDPDAGIVDTDNEITIRGTRLNPMKLRVTETTWPLSRGYTVAYRDADGNWTDLTDYIEWEPDTSSKVVVGDYTRSLQELGQNIDLRLGTLTPADTTVPGAPVLSVGATAVYLDANGLAKADQTLSWTTPLNVDTTTITDGDYYELLFRRDGTTNWDVRHIAWGQNTLTLFDLAVGTAYDAKIRALDVGGNVGAFSTAVDFTTTADSVAPSTPAAPSAATSTLAVQITHTLGKASGGTYNLESDLAFLEVHGSITTGFTPSSATLLGTVRANQGMMTASTPVVETFNIASVAVNYFKVIAVDSSGNKSAASAQASSTATLVDSAHISDLTVSKVTAGTIGADWIIGANIWTASSGERVQLNQTGIKAYNSGGINTVDIAASGSFDLKSGTSGARFSIDNSNGFRAYDSTGTQTIGITNSGTFTLSSRAADASTPTIKYIGRGSVYNATTAGSAFTLYTPDGAVENDVLVAFVAASETVSGTGITTTPTGWTRLTTVTVNDGSQDSSLVVFWKACGSSEPASAAGSFNTAVPTRRRATVFAYRGVDYSSPWVDSNTTSTATNGTTHSTASVTNTDANAWAISAIVTSDNTSGGVHRGLMDGNILPTRIFGYSGTATPWLAVTVVDSAAVVTAAAHDVDWTFTATSGTNFSSAVSFLGYLKPATTSQNQSSLVLSNTGIVGYDFAQEQSLAINAGDGSISISGQLSSGVVGSSNRVVVNPSDSSYPEIRFYPDSGDNYGYLRTVPTDTNRDDEFTAAPSLSSGTWAHTDDSEEVKTHVVLAEDIGSLEIVKTDQFASKHGGQFLVRSTEASMRVGVDGTVTHRAEVTTASGFQLFGPGQDLWVYKSTTTDRTSTSYLQDPELVLTLSASGIYAVEALVFYRNTSSSTGDITLGFTYPGSATGKAAVIAFGEAWAGSTPSDVRMDAKNVGSLSWNLGATSAGTWLMARMHGTVEMGGSGGDLAVSWGLVNASGTTGVLASSWLHAHRIS